VKKKHRATSQQANKQALNYQSVKVEFDVAAAMKRDTIKADFYLFMWAKDKRINLIILTKGAAVTVDTSDYRQGVRRYKQHHGHKNDANQNHYALFLIQSLFAFVLITQQGQRIQHLIIGFNQSPNPSNLVAAQILARLPEL
jgi:hypothetical protein